MLVCARHSKISGLFSGACSLRNASEYSTCCNTLCNYLKCPGFWYWYTNHILLGEWGNLVYITKRSLVTFLYKNTVMNRREKDVLCLSLYFRGRYWIAISSIVHKQTWSTSKAIALQPAEPRLHTSKVNVSKSIPLKFKIKYNQLRMCLDLEHCLTMFLTMVLQL